jgi:hypothetical protein
VLEDVPEDAEPNYEVKVLHYWAHHLNGAYFPATRQNLASKKNVQWFGTLDKSMFVVVNWNLTKAKKVPAEIWRDAQKVRSVGIIEGLPKVTRAKGAHYVSAHNNPLWHQGQAEIIEGGEMNEQGVRIYV